MQKQIKALTILKNKSGASMVFVLGVMLLLMAIGVSTLVAAGTSAGIGMNRQISDQLYSYTDGVQKAVMHSLQTSSDDAEENIGLGFSLEEPKTLGGQFLIKVYSEAPKPNEGSDSTKSSSAEVQLNFTPSLSTSADLTAVTDVTVMVTPSAIVITPYRSAQEEEKDDEGNIISPYVPPRPETASISGIVTVTVTAEHRGKPIVTKATYRLSGALLKEILDAGGKSTDNMSINNAGTWRFVSYEKVDQ